MTDTPAPLPVPVLDAAQMRVLGCLVEKEATTPETYPLTVNAAQTAANQKTARDPVMNLDAGTVQHALRQLEAMGLARQHFSARAERYEHLLGAKLDLPRQQVTLLGLLLLRGPQTAGELATRSERMAKFADAEDLRHQLGRLIQRGLAVQLPRASGQREDRYMHLLGGPVDVDALAAQFRAPAGTAADNGALEERVAQLDAAVAALQEQLAQLQSRLDD
ncbi:YceH family protein [Stenotrophomonas acidaminiphila]|uniref:YceH family protein n=1 Tax=Stenotrophomonas acidaminiphila TaxID=128780 RepID=UPI003BF35A4E